MAAALARVASSWVRCAEHKLVQGVVEETVCLPRFNVDLLVEEQAECDQSHTWDSGTVKIPVTPALQHRDSDAKLRGDQNIGENKELSAIGVKGYEYMGH